MKTSITIARLATGLFAFSLFAATILPTTASAQSQTIGVGNNKADCIAKQSAVTNVAKLKEYGKKRIENRTKSLKSFDDATLDRKYTALDTQFTRAKTSAERQAKVALNVAKPANHKAQIAQDRTNISNALAGKQQAVNAAATSAQVAATNCEVIWDLRVTSYIAPKLKFQLALDTFNNTNAINQALYEVAAAKGKAGSIKNPIETGNRIGKLQQQLDMITISDASAETGIKVNPLGSTASSVFNPMKAETKIITAEVKASTKALQKSSSQITAEQKAEAKKAKDSAKAEKPAPASKKEISDKAKANREAAPGACKESKGSGKVASDKEAREACEYGFKTTGPGDKRQAACTTKYAKVKQTEKRTLLTNTCVTGIQLRS